MLGPALVVSVAYMDPGNFATNMTAGSRYGPRLLWVIVLANVVAVFVQYLACKVGVATGRDLPELCREHAPRALTHGLWVQAELVAMATDLAEFVGGAVALHLLFGLPTLPAAVIVAASSLVLLAVAPEGRRRFEVVTALLLLVLVLGFVYQSLRAGSWHGALAGMQPRLAGSQSLLLATGIIGATVMPHVIYLHSSLGKLPAGTPLTQKRRVLRAHRLSIGVALGLAGLVNAGMLTLAAATLHRSGRGGESLDGFHEGLGLALGPGAALAFALALLASGLASAGVGTFAGQVIMRGFLRRRVPLTVRRLLTMAPPLVLLALGTDPTGALVLSQIVLSFGIPFALAPLLWFTARRALMGPLVNRGVTTGAAVVICAAVSGLNLFLVVLAVRG
ncbi:Nramp family divalent metal transporter [Streptomyces sp. TG1A-8]|uniref:Nramp family divalent metal transporter n=1 Tax=Streptomyces sp. TG1A-8 TaxID=3051385 RepID=UPI00265C6477|nr:Nramp family divalent metal transporter [Streptomyces sp. TG1A-8]MDO0924301.1 Nramp family divalent metal transporter [Streptomyces sp. TG1A-8]